MIKNKMLFGIMAITVLVIAFSTVKVSAFDDVSLMDKNSQYRYRIFDADGDLINNGEVDYNDVMFFEEYEKNTQDWLDFITWLSGQNNASRFIYVCDMINDYMLTQLADGWEFRTGLRSKTLTYLDDLYVADLGAIVNAEYNVYMSIYNAFKDKPLYWIPSAFSFDDSLEVWYGLMRDYQYPIGQLPSTRNCYIWGCSNGYNNDYPNANIPQPLNYSVQKIYSLASQILNKHYSNLNLNGDFFIQVEWTSGIAVYYYVKVYCCVGDEPSLIRKSIDGNNVTYDRNYDSCYYVKFPCWGKTLHYEEREYNIQYGLGTPLCPNTNDSSKWITYNRVDTTYTLGGVFNMPWYVNIFGTVNNPTFCMPRNPIYFGQVGADINIEHTSLPLPTLIPSRVSSIVDDVLPMNQTGLVTPTSLNVVNVPQPPTPTDVPGEPTPTDVPGLPTPTLYPYEPNDDYVPLLTYVPIPTVFDEIYSISDDSIDFENVPDPVDLNNVVSGYGITIATDFVQWCMGLIPFEWSVYLYFAFVLIIIGGIIYIVISG